MQVGFLRHCDATIKSMATKTSNTGRESDKFTLRFSEGMREQIRKAAESNNRTMNAEIVERLQKSFTQQVGPVGLLSSEFGLPTLEDPRNHPDLYRHVVPIPGKTSQEQRQEENQKYLAAVHRLLETTLIPHVKTMLEEYKEQERNERKRFMEIALGGAEPVSKTKKPKA